MAAHNRQGGGGRLVDARDPVARGDLALRLCALLCLNDGPDRSRPGHGQHGDMHAGKKEARAARKQGAKGER